MKTFRCNCALMMSRMAIAAACGGGFTALHLEAVVGDVLQPNAEIKLRRVEPGPHLVEGAAGGLAPGDFLVDAPLGLAPGVLEPMFGELWGHNHGLSLLWLDFASRRI